MPSAFWGCRAYVRTSSSNGAVGRSPSNEFMEEAKQVRGCRDTVQLVGNAVVEHSVCAGLGDRLPNSMLQMKGLLSISEMNRHTTIPHRNEDERLKYRSESDSTLSSVQMTSHPAECRGVMHHCLPLSVRLCGWWAFRACYWTK